MTTQQQNQPVRVPDRVRYIVRADDGVSIQEVGRGIALLAEITFAQKYHARTGHRVWVIDTHDARRTVYRLERKERAMRGGAQ